MTNEEREGAIKFFNEVAEKEVNNAKYSKLAIEALEQQPCEDWYDVPSNEMTLEQARQAVKDLRKKLAEDLEKNLCGDLISRQAAIDIIESWLSCDDYNEAERNIMRAMQSILYDLPSVKPQQPCDDCISRQAVLEIAKSSKSNWIDNSVLFKRVNELPPVTPKEKTGKWIFDEILDRHYYCSECKSMGVDYWDYCPECGARMVSE